MCGHDVPLNTDDRTILEFAFARNLRMSSGVSFDRLRQDARFLESDHPTCKGELDWENVKNQRAGMFVPSDSQIRLKDEMPREQRLLAVAFKSYIDSDLTEAWRHWRQLEREPRSPVELVMVAECLADQGDAKAIPYIEELQKIALTDARAIEARLLWRQNKIDEAGALLEKVCIAYHTDPWPLRGLMTRTMDVMWRVAQTDKTGAIARSLYRAVERPFLIYNVDEARMTALLRLGTEIDHGRIGEFVLQAIEAPEPNIPWQLNFLKARSSGYAHFHHPLAEVAKRDLAEFVEADPDLSENGDSPIINPRDRVASTGERP